MTTRSLSRRAELIPRRMLLRTCGVIVGTSVLVAALAACQPLRSLSPSGGSLAPTASTESPIFPTSTPEPSVTQSASEIASPSPLPEGSVTIITLEVSGGAVQASGVLASVAESGGVCTLTLRRGAITRSVAVDASAGRESTYCGLASIALADLTSGVWIATLAYRSTILTGTSAPTPITVP